MNNSLSLLNKIYDLNLSEEDCKLLLEVIKILDVNSDQLNEAFNDSYSSQNVKDIIQNLLFSVNLEGSIEFNLDLDQFSPVVDKDIKNICKKLNCLILK